MGISSRLVLPCLVTGCHTFGFKIATAALRPRNGTKMERFYLKTNVLGRMQAVSTKINVPFLHKSRNDTKSKRFCLENGRFAFYAAVFCAVLLRIVFQTFRHRFSNVLFRKPFCFPTKPIFRFVIARRARAPDAAILNGTRRHPGTKHGKARAMIYSRRLYNGWYASAYITQQKVERHCEAAALQYSRRALQAKQTPPGLG